MVDAIEAVERRRRLIRGILLAIIIGTLPFYCIGFVLWGTAPSSASRTPTATFTPIGGDVTLQPTQTATTLVTTTLVPTTILLPSPTGIIIFPTRILSPSPTFLLPPTIAPTLTSAPTNTPIPASDTPFPTLLPPTNTLEPTATSERPTEPPPVEETVPPIEVTKE